MKLRFPCEVCLQIPSSLPPTSRPRTWIRIQKTEIQAGEANTFLENKWRGAGLDSDSQDEDHFRRMNLLNSELASGPAGRGGFDRAVRLYRRKFLDHH